MDRIEKHITLGDVIANVMHGMEGPINTEDLIEKVCHRCIPRPVAMAGILRAVKDGKLKRTNHGTWQRVIL